MKTKILAIVLFLVTFFSVSSYSQSYSMPDTVEVSITEGTSTYIVDKLSTREAKTMFVADKLTYVINNSKMITDIDLGETNLDKVIFTVNDRINSDDIKELNTLISIFTMNNYYRTKPLEFLVISEDNKVLISLVLTHSIEEINGNKATYKCNIAGIIDTNLINTKYTKDLLLKYTSVLCYKILSYDYY